MARICFRACRSAKGTFKSCGSGGRKKGRGGKKRHCRYGKNKRTGRCLKHPRK